MTLYDNAIRHELSDRLVAAADEYEQLLRTDAMPVDAFTNLACLYWQCTDFGFRSWHHLSDDFVERAEARSRDVLKSGLKRFPEESELNFWSKYFDFINYGFPFTRDECEQLAFRPHSSLVPYFYLFIEAHGQEFREETRRLRIQCEELLTVKNRYILSVLGSHSITGTA